MRYILSKTTYFKVMYIHIISMDHMYGVCLLDVSSFRIITPHFSYDKGKIIRVHLWDKLNINIFKYWFILNIKITFNLFF